MVVYEASFDVHLQDRSLQVELPTTYFNKARVRGTRQGLQLKKKRLRAAKKTNQQRDTCVRYLRDTRALEPFQAE
jgi:hypothetical protein